MASFDTMGLDALILDLDEISELDDDTAEAMLEAGGEVIRKAHVAEIKSRFSSHSGKFEASPTVHKKMGGNGSQRYVLIYPGGPHHTYKATVSTYTKMNWGRKGITKTKGGGTKETSNQDVGFVHEFGGHGNAATQWMREANEKHAGEAVEAEFAVFDKWHKSHNL